MIYAFTFDASACSGCKACQVACKDKNNLPLGVLWRRVFEVSGGSWQRVGDAWATDVFSYNLSVACNHCVHPKCAGVCPTDAFVQREDGIVYIDESKCIGCGYCNWACPYGVPQYNPELGQMSKCNFCMDNLEVGLPPACVAACPMRVLDFVSISPISMGEGQGVRALWEIPATEHPFPLPQQSRTEPHLAIKPHAGMSNLLDKQVSNREEVKPAKVKSEFPLVIFTLLGQMAAGMAAFSLFSGSLSIGLLLTIGALIGAGALATLLHLGKPSKAWRAVVHLKKSWLSREILVFGLFGGSWFVSLAMPGMGKLPLAVLGIGLVYAMAQVYRLRSVPAWDSYRTLLAFTISMIVLGGLGLGVVNLFGSTAFKTGYQFTGGAVLVGALWLSLSEQNQAHQTASRLRSGLIVLSLFGVLGMVFLPATVGRGMVVPVFAIALIEEAIGRWLFYEYPYQRIL